MIWGYHYSWKHPYGGPSDPDPRLAPKVRQQGIAGSAAPALRKAQKCWKGEIFGGKTWGFLWDLTFHSRHGGHWGGLEVYEKRCGFFFWPTRNMLISFFLRASKRPELGCCSAGVLRRCCFFGGFLWGAEKNGMPTFSEKKDLAIQHQDYCFFLVQAFQTKPSFSTVTGWGVDPTCTLFISY